MHMELSIKEGPVIIEVPLIIYLESPPKKSLAGIVFYIHQQLDVVVLSMNM